MKRVILLAILLCTIFVKEGHAKQDQLLKSNFTEYQYKDVENIFVSNTDHLKKLDLFVQKNILPFIPSKDKFLDIGAGPGYITELLSKHFNSTTVVEPNQEYFPRYQTHGYTIHKNNFQDVDTKISYDFVLCSHMLYHLNQDEWPAFIKKVYDSIGEDGKALIVLVAPRGDWHDLRTSINPEYSHSGKVENILKNSEITFEAIPTRSSFKSANYNDFRKLLQLFTIDDCYTPEQFKNLSKEDIDLMNNKIDAFIEKCKSPNGTYQLIYEDQYIVLHKEQL